MLFQIRFKAGLFLFERRRWSSPFHWDELLASVRQMRALKFDWVIDLQGLARSGLFAWLAWLFIHLMYLVGFQNRVVVFIRWAFNYFTYNRGARLITGEPDSQFIIDKRESREQASVTKSP